MKRNVDTHRENLRKFQNSFVSILAIFILFPISLCAQQETEWQEIYLLDKNEFNNPYVDFVSDDINDFFNPQTENSYPSTNLFDGYFKTCWVAGLTETKTSSLYIKLSDKIDLDKLILNIFSGYGKSKNLYYANARPKKIKLSLYAAVYPDGFSTEVASLYGLKEYPLNKLIHIKDTFELQSFPLNLDKNELIRFQKEVLTQALNYSGPEFNKIAGSNSSIHFSASFILKIEILDSFPGTKYDDVCISEIFFNDRFITHYPDKYSQIEDVYIKDDNTLMVDYFDKKSVVIYRDTTSVFTYVDWLEHSNWAMLNHVPNDEYGGVSRNEELYSLVDLKNRKLVDSEFENSTGLRLMFKTFMKDDNSKLFLQDENFNVELK